MTADLQNIPIPRGQIRSALFTGLLFLIAVIVFAVPAWMARTVKPEASVLVYVCGFFAVQGILLVYFLPQLWTQIRLKSVEPRNLQGALQKLPGVFEEKTTIVYAMLGVIALVNLYALWKEGQTLSAVATATVFPMLIAQFPTVRKYESWAKNTVKRFLQGPDAGW